MQTKNANSNHRASTFAVTRASPTTRLSEVRALLIAESPEPWLERFAPFMAQGIHLDAADSALAGLAAFQHAATPYGIVMLGRRVQGMDATVLATAIKGEATAAQTLFAFLGNPRQDEARALAQAGFSALICEDAAPCSLLRTLDELWNAAVDGRLPEFLHADAGTPHQLSGRRALIADDNPVNREVAARMLENLGFACTPATDGQEAVELHRSRRFDLILMDCDMPRMDGFEATKLIRSSEPASCRTLIVALTASTAEEEREKCIASGMNDFLTKPIRPEAVKDVLGRWLKDAGRSVSTSEATAVEDELEAVHEMFGPDFAELAALYQRDTPPRLAALHQAYVVNDTAVVAKVAHALAGSSASIGATGLSGLCRSLEARAKAGVLEEFEERVGIIAAEYRRVQGRLQSMTE